jgi:hypothetical protein
MITIDINTVFSVGACLVSLAALGAVVSLYKSLEHWRGRCLALEASLPSLRREVDLMASLNARTGRQVEKIAHECLDVQDRVELVEQRGTGRAVGDAVDSARRGADLGKLSQQFGLSRGEAELVSRLHGQRRSA